MMHFNGFNRFLIKYLAYSPIHNDRFLSHFKISVNCIHSLQQSNPKKPFKRFTQNSRKPFKSGLKKNAEDTKFYMRDTVLNIYRMLKYSSWDTAKEQLSELRIKWDSYTVNQVLKTHPPMEKAWLFFNWVSGLKGFKHDQFTYTTMLDIFGEAGRMASMNYVFKEMQEKGIKIDAVTYTSLMHWVSSSGDIDGAMKIWEEMKDKGCRPTVVSYTAYMKILFGNERIKEAKDVYKQMLECEITPTCHTYTILMDYLVSAGKCQEALDIFSDMQEAGVEPDKAACNILVERCCKVGETKAMTQILEYMKNNSLVLRYPIFLEALKSLKAAGKSDVLLREVNPHCATDTVINEDAFEFVETDDDDPLDKGLVLFLLKKQNLVAVDRLVSGIIDKDILLDSWIISAIIEVNCDHCRPDGALVAFDYSMKMGYALERTLYLALVGILIRSNMYMKVVEIVEEMIKAGHSLGIYSAALLVYRLGCARPTCAAKIFNLFPDDLKCIATYTALISVYFAAGSAEKGLKIYTAMRENGIHPSVGTYNVLIAGLEGSGKVNETIFFRNKIRNLLTDGYCWHSIPMDVNICDLLFSEDLVS